MRTQALAKLSRPAQPGVVARERLFTAVDAARTSPLIWISGPAGAGKTTLLASYIDARGIPCIWYQLDGADEDPAVLFDTLTSCLAKRGPRLPDFAPQSRDSVAAFARRYFRQFFARLPERSMLVFDTATEFAANGTLAQIVHEAAQEVPGALNLVVLSRSPPLEKFVRLRLQCTLAEIGWDDLRLQPEETRAIAAHHRATRTAQADQLHELCGGWVAGLRLLLERPGSEADASVDGGRGRDALFSYIAAELFVGLDAATQDALLRTCYLPEVSQRTAYALTKDPNAWKQISELHLRRLFVDLHGERTPVLRYHMLFREFLIATATARFAPLELRALQRDSAGLLIRSGRAEAAVPLLTQAGDWPTASRIILEEANSMLTRGHTHTLHAWLAALPSWYVDATPRLLYCLGLAQTTSNPAAAIDALKRAHDRFEAQRNPVGQALCAAAIIQALYFGFDDYSAMLPWADRLGDLMQEDLVYPSAETELHLTSQLQIALTYVDPINPRLAWLTERLLALIARDLDVNQRVVAAGMLLTYLDWFATDKAPLLVTFVQPLLRNRALTPFNRVWWSMAEAHHCHCAGEAAQYANSLAHVDAMRSEHDISFSDAVLATLRLPLALSDPTAEIDLHDTSRALAALDPSRRQEEINLRGYLAELDLSRGHSNAGLANAKQALALSQVTALKVSEMEMWGLLAVGYADTRRFEEAAGAVDAARAIAGGNAPPKLAFHHLLLESYIALGAGDQARARTSMQRAFALAREQGYTKTYQWMPHLLARVCAEALDAGIESTTVRHIVRARKLRPPEGLLPDDWPWPVKIHVLGKFEVSVDNRPLRFERKAPKKPLDLLKLLVAGGGGATDQSILAHALWPDSDGDTADSALRMAVHRLRKLLCHDDALVVNGSKLNINTALCWVDAWAFEAAHRAAESADTTQSHEALLRLYAGEAFAGDAVQPWMLAARDRWRSRFIRAVGIAGTAYEARHQWQSALDAYERGIHTDPLCEAFYQGVMRCHLRQGKPAEAYGAYRRCREALSIRLNVKPSAQTEALREQIA